MSAFGLDPSNFDPENLDRVVQEAEQTMKRLASVEGELAHVRGTATGADDMISVVTDGNGRLERLDLDPRTRRLETHVLAEELLKTIRAAQDDGERRTRELVGEALGGVGLPHGGFGPAEMERRLTEAAESFDHAMEWQTARLRASGAE